VIRSRDQPGFKELRDATLDRLSSAHLARGWIPVPYAVTAWDEFQGLILEVGLAPRVMWSVLEEFQPLRLRIGLGVGTADFDRTSDAPLNQVATGEAFHRARRALDLVKKGSDSRFNAALQAITGDRSIDLYLNTVLHLLDALVARTTPSQWQAIVEYGRLGTQERVAQKLDKAESTISRALKRAYYWQMAEAIDALVELLTARFGAPQNVGSETRTP
jgi:hypothetical protein